MLVYSSTGAYQAGCRARLGRACDGRFGFYRPELRTIFVNASLGVTSVDHEMVHPIVQSDFPLAPLWWNEGLGALYERPVFDADGGVHGATDFRLERLQAALRSPRERGGVSLEALFAMSDEDFRAGDLELHYAEARFACQWLDEAEGGGRLWPMYRAWRDGARGDPTGEKAWAAVVGGTPAEATERWRAWVMGLRFVPGG